MTTQDLARRAAIEDYDVTRRPPRADLQGLVELAARVCAVPTAVINIIDDREQHQVAAVGFSPAVCAREDSMCAQVIAQPGRVGAAPRRLELAPDSERPGRASPWRGRAVRPLLGVPFPGR